ncbi:MAG: MOSC domain-containing protein [Geitlerinemataceae cyanobacterium]
MTAPTVTQLFTHPIKGLTPQEIDRTILETDFGIPGDRAFALMFTDATEEPERLVPWMSKKHFAVQNDWPGLAALDCRYYPENHCLIVRKNKEEVLSANTTTERDRIDLFFSDYLAGLTPTESARHPHPSSVKLVGDPTGNTRYPDRHPVHISLVSQATLEAIAAAVGDRIDVRRFRPNILLDGVSPWEEFEWVGREISIGTAKLTISAPIGRCLNIEVNPETGERDLPLFSLLQEHFGHGKTGVVAKVNIGGAVEVGDGLAVSG